MIERKNIDRLFQERFKDFESVPDEIVWENIEAELKKKKKRRIIPFWLRLSGVAAVLLIGLILMTRYLPGNNGPEKRVVSGEEKELQQSAGNNNGTANDNSPEILDSINGTSAPVVDLENENTDRNGSVNHQAAPSGGNLDSGSPLTLGESEKGNKNKATQKSGTENSGNLKTLPTSGIVHQSNKRGRNHVKAAENRIASENDNPDEKSLTTVPQKQSDAIVQSPDKQAGIIVQTNVPAEKNNSVNPTENNITGTEAIAENAGIKKDSAAPAVVPNTLEELLNEKENKVTTKERKVNRWQITSNVAPIYFSSTSNGSPLDSRFEANEKDYAVSLSYGAGVKYAINKKISVKSGVNAVSLEYNTTGLVFFQSPNARQLENVKSNVPGSLIEVDNKPLGYAPANLGRTVKQYSGNLNQKTGYIEVPVEVTYKVLDRKFAIDVIGGMSTLFLNQNEVSIMSSGLEMNIGEASNLNDVHFSTNVGVGFRYTFLKSFQASVEPMFKYQINTFSNDSGNFKPYFFGLYTGLSYRF
jgi:hypothetical protein